MINAGDGGVKKSILTTTAATRRPALGNLMNQTDRSRQINDKKINNSNESCNTLIKPSIDLKNVKARVDSHWKNEPSRKAVVSRNNSIRKASGTGISGLPNTNSGPKLVKTKTTETATLKEVKLIDKSDRTAVIKRQDSTLTRRKIVSGPKTATVEASKKTVTRTRSADSESDAVSQFIVDVPVVQSRFRPPHLATSYSNGLINGVSTCNLNCVL